MHLGFPSRVVPPDVRRAAVRLPVFPHVVRLREGDLGIVAVKAGPPPVELAALGKRCLLYTSPSPRDAHES
eukprot:5660517-Prymnesium_polylepis.1